MTPLHIAAENAHNKLVEHLVNEGANINIQDSNGVNICRLVLLSVYLKVADSLCTYGAGMQCT